MKIGNIVISLLILALSACSTGALTNPNRLVPPVILTYAGIYMDGGSIGGTLRDSNGQQFEFFFDLGFDSKPGAIFIGHAPERKIPLMRVRFKDWLAEDLYELIERTVRDQFVWDKTTKRLRPRNAESIPGVGPYDLMFTSTLLLYVEVKLHRKTSYMR